MFEINDFVARVGVGPHIQPGDQFVKERMLAGISDEHDLVRAVIRIVTCGTAQLRLHGPREHGLQPSHHFTGLG